MVLNIKNKILAIGIATRKTAKANILLTDGTGIIIINNKIDLDYFSSIKDFISILYKSLKLTNLENKYNIIGMVHGGGLMSQLDAIKLAISKAIYALDKSKKFILKTNSLLTTDSRVKERKKYGLKKARKAPQYVKR